MLKKELCFGVGKSMGGGNLHFVSAETKEHVNLFLKHSSNTSEYPPASHYLVEINGNPTDQVYYDLNVNDGDDVNIICLVPQSGIRYTFYHNKLLLDIYEIVDPLPNWHTSLYSICRSCKSLNKIPPNLFENYDGYYGHTIDLSYFFRDTAISSIPLELLHPFRNTSVNVNTTGMFQKTKITEIPENLFSGVNITNVIECFQSTEIELIPEKIFNGLTNLRYCSGVFDMCKNVTSIPPKLFETNVNLTYVGSYSYGFGAFGCFSRTSVTSIPPEIFKNNSKLEDVSACFADTPITEIPEDLFKNNPDLKYAAGTFYKTSITKIPDNIFSNNLNLIGVGKATVSGGCFQNTKITEIPENLFTNNIKLKNISNCFKDTLITKIPENLFSTLSELTEVEAVFHNTPITEIPEKIFYNNTKISNCGRSLYEYGLFGKTLITEIPENLFINNPEIMYFDEVFMFTNIKTIPENLFINNTKITSFTETFKNSKLESIPEGLFRNNTNVIDFEGTFSSCKNLREIPEKLFENCTEVTSFGGRYLTSNTDGCFQSCSNLNIVPKNLFKNQLKLVNIGKSYSGLFHNCTNISTDIYLYSKDIIGDLGTTSISHWIGVQSKPINIWIYTKNDDGTETETYKTFKNCTRFHYELGVTNELNLTLKALD